MSEFGLIRWFDHARRPIDALVRRINYMEGSLINRDSGRPTRTPEKPFKNILI